MQNLKPVYDAAVAAEAKVSSVMAEMLAAFDEGSEEGKARALEMRPALDQAKEEARAANELYVSMRDAAAASDDAARKFVPVDAALAAGAKPGSQAKEITRAEYEGMAYAERHAYLKAGGAIVDNPVG
jgi:hypothetical protein